jgi:adenylylsulfate kinase-like enzyme
MNQPVAKKEEIKTDITATFLVRMEDVTSQVLEGITYETPASERSTKIRSVINKLKKDYSEKGRRKNIETAHAIAKYLQKQSLRNDIIISLVSPFRDLREKLKSETECKEFYIHTTEIRGRESFHVANYEKPLENFLDVDTTVDDELTTINFILDNLKQQ